MKSAITITIVCIACATGCSRRGSQLQPQEISPAVRHFALGCLERTATTEDCTEYLRQARLEATTKADHDLIQNLAEAIELANLALTAAHSGNYQAVNDDSKLATRYYNNAAKLLGIPESADNKLSPGGATGDHK